MQQIDLATIKSAKAADRRALAILAYDNASADPAAANWRGVADILRLALPAAKATAKIPGAEADPTRPAWADYDIPQNATRKLGKSPIIVVTLADGETVRAPAVSLPGKPVNIGRGLRIAFAYYRARMAARHAGEMAAWSDCVNVPALVSVVCQSTDAEYDAADCNARTAEFRAGEFDYGGVTAEAAARGLPGTSNDGSLTVAEYVRAKYRAAKARLRLAYGVDDEIAAMLAATIEDSELRAAGVLPLEIAARRREIERQAYEAVLAAEQAERDAAHAAEREQSARTNTPSGPDDADPSSGPDSPVGLPAFKVPSRFLSSSHLTLVSNRVA